MTEISGYCDAPFESLGEAFAANFDEGLELGASLAVTHHGKVVVDLFGGHADRNRTKLWDRDTIVNTFSITKIPLTVCALMLMDEGRLEIDSPLKTYWPEMDGEGKERITIRHVLLHATGLPGFVEQVPFEAKYDWNRMIHLLEQEPLWFEPGTAQAYHSETFGFLLGEVIRRITGEMPGVFFRTRIAEPLDIDFHIGLPESEEHRVGQLLFEGMREMPDPDSIGFKVMNSFTLGDWEAPETRAVEMPASNGTGNARSVAKIGAALAMGGELNGVRLMSRDTVEFATREHSRETDLAMESVVARGLGFGLESEFFMAMSPDAFFWGGYGGAICEMDLKRQVSLAYIPNRLDPNIESEPRNRRLVEAMRTIMERLEAF